ncbi:MAG TPA: shikimate dehydrogenase [Armatimonadota bacterium]|nr:shikimate dehydrogenase [Armatimonadota bacterium]
MNKFGFILHPLSAADVGRRYPIAKYFPPSWVEGVCGRMSSKFLGHIHNLRGYTGAAADGCFVGCPLTPRQFTEWPVEQGYERILQAVDMAARWGAKIVGLGAFTAVVGDKGVTIAERSGVGITTGNSYTVYTAVEGAIDAARRMGIEPSESRAAILGATGSIGRACALLLGNDVASLSLVGRRPGALSDIADEVKQATSADADCYTDVGEGTRDADIVIAVTSAVESIIEPEHVKSGAVVCDVARPRNASRALIETRNDVLVIDGGAVAVPGENFDFGFDFGFPAGLAYACMAETMILGLEGRYENYSLGAEMKLEQVQEMGELAAKHGFRLSGYRCLERTLTDEDIAQKREAGGR